MVVILKSQINIVILKYCCKVLVIQCLQKYGLRKSTFLLLMRVWLKIQYFHLCYFFYRFIFLFHIKHFYVFSLPRFLPQKFTLHLLRRVIYLIIFAFRLIFLFIPVFSQFFNTTILKWVVNLRGIKNKKVISSFSFNVLSFAFMLV